jgi:hypothetical protein
MKLRSCCVGSRPALRQPSVPDERAALVVVAVEAGGATHYPLCLSAGKDLLKSSSVSPTGPKPGGERRRAQENDLVIIGLASAERRVKPGVNPFNESTAWVWLMSEVIRVEDLIRPTAWAT